MGEISHTRGVTRRRARMCDLDGRWPGKDAVPIAWGVLRLGSPM